MRLALGDTATITSLPLMSAPDVLSQMSPLPPTPAPGGVDVTAADLSNLPVTTTPDLLAQAGTAAVAQGLCQSQGIMQYFDSSCGTPIGTYLMIGLGALMVFGMVSGGRRR